MLRTATRHNTFRNAIIAAAALAAAALAALATGGDTRPSALAQTTPPPGQVVGLTADPQSGYIRLEWEDPVDASVTSYDVCRQTTSTLACTTTWTQSNLLLGDGALGNSGGTNNLGEHVQKTGSTLSFIVDANALTAGTTYYFWVRARNNAPTPQLTGDPSDPVTVVNLADARPSFGTASTPVTALTNVSVRGGDPVDVAMPPVIGGDRPLAYEVHSRASGAPAWTPGLAAVLAARDDGQPLFDTNTGRIYGTSINHSTATTYNVRVRVTDNDIVSPDTAQVTFNIAISTAVNAVPAFGSTTIPEASRTYYDLQNYLTTTNPAALTVPTATGGLTGGADTPLTYTATGLPPGLSIASAVGAIFGTPAAVAQETTYNVTVTVTDANGDSDDVSFVLIVTPDKQPTIARPGNFTFIEDQALTDASGTRDPIQLSASGGNGALTYALEITSPSSTTLASVGLQLDSATGKITTTNDNLGGSGGINADASYVLSATVSDVDGDSASASFRISILNDTSPSVGNLSPATFRAGDDVTVSAPAVTGGNPPLTYSANNLTRGLSIDSATGVISGTVEATGPSSAFISITVTDVDGDSGTSPQAAGWSFSGSDSKPTLPTQADITLTKGVAIASPFHTLPAATGGDGTITYSVSTDLSASNFEGAVLPRGETEGALPAGLSFAAGTRVLSGTPTNAFSAVTVTYTATDADGDAVSLTFKINSGQVILLNADDTLMSNPTNRGLGATEGVEYSFKVKLASAPSRNATVTVNIGSSDSVFRLGTTSSASGGTYHTGTQANVVLTFTPSTPVVGTDPAGATIWSEAQTVYYYFGSDSDGTDFGRPTFTVGCPMTNGCDYAGVASPTSPHIYIVNRADSGSKYFVATPREITIPEGGVASFTGRLSQAPSSNTTITFPTATGLTIGRSYDPSTGVVSGLRTREFTSSNWQTPATWYVSAAQDADTANIAVITVTPTRAAGGDTGVTPDTAGEVTVKVIDDDFYGVESENAGTPLALMEGTPATFRFRLGAAPASGATSIRVTPSGAGLRFGASDSSGDVSTGDGYIDFALAAGTNIAKWDTWQTLYAEPLEDNDDEAGSSRITYTVTVTGTDTNYSGTVTHLTRGVTITDDDSPGVIIDTDTDMTGDQAGPLAIGEFGIDDIDIRLATQPEADVNVVMTLGGSPDLQFVDSGLTTAQTRSRTKTLTFTPSNWSTNQRFQIVPLADDDADNDVGSIGFAFTGSADAQYLAVPASPAHGVAVTTAGAQERLVINVTDQDDAGRRREPIHDSHHRRRPAGCRNARLPDSPLQQAVRQRNGDAVGVPRGARRLSVHAYLLHDGLERQQIRHGDLPGQRPDRRDQPD